MQPTRGELLAFVDLVASGNTEFEGLEDQAATLLRQAKNSSVITALQAAADSWDSRHLSHELRDKEMMELLGVESVEETGIFWSMCGEVTRSYAPIFMKVAKERDMNPEQALEFIAGSCTALGFNIALRAFQPEKVAF